MKRWLMSLTLLIGLGLIAAPVFGQTLLDPNLYVCQSCTSAPSAPTLITDTTGFNVGVAGNNATVSPLLIVVGTYDGAPAPQVSYGTTLFSPGGSAIYGWNGSASATNFSSANGTTDAFSAVGITDAGGGSSEQFGNWNGDLTANGLPTASSFSLYVYELTGVTLPSQQSTPDNITLNLEGGTNGSFVIGYACEVAGTTCSGGDVAVTPNTTAGIVDSTPEPASMVLFGTFLLLASFVLRRHFGMSH